MSADTEAQSNGSGQMDELGPIDIAVIGFSPDAPMTGDAVPILMDLVERRIIRVLDVLFVTKGADGSVAGFDATNLDERGVGEFSVFEGASSGVLGNDDVATVADELEPGWSAVALVYENRWAAPFVAAVRRNGGEPMAFHRISVPDLIEALDAAEAAS